MSSAQPKPGLSARGMELYDEGDMRSKYSSIFGNPYHSETNSSGFLNLGTAENYVMLDEVAKFASERVHFIGTDIDYGEGPWGGRPLRSVMAAYMDNYFNPLQPVNPDEILFGSGCTSLFEMTGYSIGEPGDAILLSQPCYQAFERDFGVKTKLKCVFVPFEGIDQFSMESVPCYEKVLNSTAKSDTRVRAILICNPHNPLGRCYPPEVLTAYMDLCNKYSIHLFVDEIYAMSVYTLPDHPTDPVPFHSVLSLDSAKHISPDYLHAYYGFSKDLASGGLRLGCIWTKNAALIQSMSGLSIFSGTSNVSECIATAMLSDTDWISNFLSLSRTRLAERSALARKLLNEYGIPYGKSANAGFFLWIDLRKWLPGKSKEGEEGWKAENILMGRILDKGVFITNGGFMHAEEPGFFRFCFVKPEGEIREGLKRLVEVLESGDDGA